MLLLIVAIIAPPAYAGSFALLFIIASSTYVSMLLLKAGSAFSRYFSKIFVKAL